MSEDTYDKKHKKRRQYHWLYIIILALSTSVVVLTLFPDNMKNSQYVPSIASGLIAVMSVLMASALFSLSHYRGTILDKKKRGEYHSLAMIYLMGLLLVMIMGIVIGYALILNGAFGYAIDAFLISISLIFGLIVDMWLASDKISLG